MKALYLILFCFLSCMFGFSQNVGDLYLFEYPEPLSNPGDLNDLKVDYDGGFFITAMQTEDDLGVGEVPKELIAKVNRELDLLYSRNLYVDNYGTTAYYFIVRSFKPLANGEILIGGVVVRDGWSIRHVFTLKLDINGNLAWFRRFASIDYKFHDFYHFYIDETNPEYFYYGAYYYISEDPDDLNNYQDRDLFLVKANLSDGLALSYTPLDVYDDVGFVAVDIGNVYPDRFNADVFFLDTGLYPLPLRKLTHGFIKFNTSGEVLQTHHIGREPNYDTIPYIPSLVDPLNHFYTLGGEMTQLPSGNIAYISHGRGVMHPDSALHGYAAHFLKLSPEGDILDIHGLFPPESPHHRISPLEMELYADSLLFAGGRLEPMFSIESGDDLVVFKLDTLGQLLDSLTLPIYEGWVITGYYSDTSGLYVWYNGYKAGQANVYPLMGTHFLARINTETMELDTLKSSDFDYPSHYLSDSTYNTADIVIPIENIIGIPDLSEGSSVDVYPNPAQDVIHWSLKNVVQISVHNAQGNVFIHQPISDSFLDISGLPSGVYTILFTDLNSKQTIGKFVVK